MNWKHLLCWGPRFCSVFGIWRQRRVKTPCSASLKSVWLRQGLYSIVWVWPRTSVFHLHLLSAGVTDIHYPQFMWSCRSDSWHHLYSTNWATFLAPLLKSWESDRTKTSVVTLKTDMVKYLDNFFVNYEALIRECKKQHNSHEEKFMPLLIITYQLQGYKTCAFKKHHL